MTTPVTLRSILLLGALAAPTLAQVQNDTDLDLSTAFWANRGHVRCLELAATRDEVVAAFVQEDPVFTNTNRLMVAVSKDKGRNWKPLYRELRGELFIKDLAIAVADGYAGHPEDRWIYILQEVARPNVWDPTTWSRIFRLIEGPIDQPWGGRYPYVHLIGGTNKADLSKLDEPLHPSLTVARDTGRRDQYIVVATHRWVDDGDSRVVWHTPLTGSRGSGFGTGWQVVAGPNGAYSGGEYAHPSITSDPVGRNIAIAFEDRAADTVLVTLADVETIQRGTAGFQPDFESDPQRGPRHSPHVGYHDNIGVLTALGAPNAAYPGTYSLHWYEKQRLAPFQLKSAPLHSEATSSAPVDYRRGEVYVVAHVAADPNRSRNPGHAMAFWGRASHATLTGTTVGDWAANEGTPTLAVVEEGIDRGVYGYTVANRWRSPVQQALWVDHGN